MTTSYRPIAGDPWILARPKLRKRDENDKGFYGAYPSGFLWRARSLLGIHPHDPLLHVCGGRVKDYAGDSEGLGPNDRTVDIDPTTEPDFLMDVRNIGLRAGKQFPLLVRDAGTTRGSCIVGNVEKKERAADSPLIVDGRDYTSSMLWPAALIDRPYTAEDAEHYFAGKGREVFPENLGELLASVMSCVRPGACVGILDYLVPSPPMDAKFVSMTPVWCGYNNRIRAYSVFRRPLTEKKGKKAKPPAEVQTSDEAPGDVDVAALEEDPLDVAAGPPLCTACTAPAVTVLHGVATCDRHRPLCTLARISSTAADGQVVCGKPAKAEGPVVGTFVCADHARAEPVAAAPLPMVALAPTSEDAALRSAAFDI